MHSGIYALQESVRQMRGTAPPKSPAPNLDLPRRGLSDFSNCDTGLCQKSTGIQDLGCARPHLAVEMSCLQLWQCGNQRLKGGDGDVTRRSLCLGAILLASILPQWVAQPPMG